MDWNSTARLVRMLLGAVPLLASSGCCWMTGLATYLIVESAGSSGSDDSPAPLPPPAPLELESKPFQLLDAEPLGIVLGDFVPDARGSLDAAVAFKGSQQISFFQGDGTALEAFRAGASKGSGRSPERRPREARKARAGRRRAGRAARRDGIHPESPLLG